MSIIVRGLPDPFSPVFNPIYFYSDSTNESETNFRFVVDIFPTGSSSRISRTKLFPSPTLGYGISEIQNILSTQIGYYFNPNLSGFTSIPQNYFEYYIEFGEEFLVDWPYTGNYSASGGTWVGFSAGTATTHSFVVDDRVQITPAVNAGNSGTYTVMNVPNNYQIEILKTYDSANNDSGGTITTGINTVYTGLSTVSGYICFNGVVDHQNLADWNGYVDYDIKSGTTKSILTKVPNYYPVKLENKMFLNIFSTLNTDVFGFIIRCDNGNEYQINNTVTGSTKMLQFACGPADITASTYTTIAGPTGTTEMFSGVSSYYIFCVDMNDVEISERKHFVINDNCFRYENIELLFMDKLGSFIPFNFELQNTRTINVNRTTYNSTLGGFAGGKWTFDSTDVGKQIMNINSNEELELQSDWLTPAQLPFFKELLTSPVVYMKENGKYWPVIITSNTSKLLTQKNKKNINYKITIEYANQNNTQHF